MKILKPITTTLIMLFALQINAQITPKNSIKKKTLAHNKLINRLPKVIEYTLHFPSGTQKGSYHFEYNKKNQIAKMRRNIFASDFSGISFIYSFYYNRNNKLEKLHTEDLMNDGQYNNSTRFFYNDDDVLYKIEGNKYIENLHLNTTQDKVTWGNTIFRLKKNNCIYYDWMDSKTQMKEYMSLDIDFNKKGVFSSVNLDIASIIDSNYANNAFNYLFLHQYQINRYTRTATFWNIEDEIKTNEIIYNLRYIRDEYNRVIQVIAEQDSRDHQIVYKITY